MNHQNPSPSQFEPLKFVNDSPDLGNDTDHSEEIDLTVRNSQQNSKYISKWRPPVVVNMQ